ncbi:hypothetical protein LTR56_012657 [Elasticomyces elasticus]|nr:hypothetical protein LTR56_012657 [Elasticomyces elasticus]KAK3668286.1 hypothetical protein LTR22_000971 [Elasticomyces elasticus]KAK4922777.1 hypothetical protein LTR49_009965 [Elasticomyces elasticus]KAK5769389.1 hypothetical protein LTS12_000316 [Elasticomyces elasticus]
MRLLNTTTLKSEEFMDPKQVKYSILSHCWSQDRENPEVSHQAFLARSYNKDGAGYQKILRCCKLSKERGWEYTWIDTCCVDKTSSAELSETINSMFAWYRNSAECYVFMDDLTVDVLAEVEEIDAEGRWRQGLGHEAITDVYAFIDSRWYARGWTLQELLAPSKVHFYNRKTHLLGTKWTLAALIAYATGIHIAVIAGLEGVFDASIAQRMSWASARQNTRPEDVAYSLLGIFDVNMPLLYGEGDKAFMRLQEAIIRQSDDQSILAWGLHQDQKYLSSVLAQAPSAFRGCGDIVNLSRADPDSYLAIEDHKVESPGRHGLHFADMSSFSLVKAGLEIRHQNPLVRGLLRGNVSLNLGCYYRRRDADSNRAIYLRLVLHTTNKGWRRSGIAYRNTGVWKWSRVQERRPYVLWASLDEQDAFRIACRPYGSAAFLKRVTKVVLRRLLLMLPAQNLAIVALAICIHVSTSDSTSNGAVSWGFVGGVAVGVLAIQMGVVGQLEV